jgi:hypothetical protein
MTKSSKEFTFKTTFTTHSPQEDRGSFETRSILREMFSWRIGRYRFSMNSRAFAQAIYSRQKVFVCPEQFSGQTKKPSLRDLCVSVVKANNFMLCLIFVIGSFIIYPRYSALLKPARYPVFQGSEALILTGVAFLKIIVQASYGGTSRREKC